MNAKSKSEVLPERGSIAERSPFHVKPEDLNQWIKTHYPFETAEDWERLRRGLEEGDEEVRKQFAEAGWTFTD